MNIRPYTILISVAITFAFTLILASFSLRSAISVSTNQTLPDLSGIAWIEVDTFFAVHDAKFPDEAAAPRASLLSLPSKLGGTVITPLNIDWPRGENMASDLECVARLPDVTQNQDAVRFLIAESGDDGEGSKRIFLSELKNGTLMINNTVSWPVDVYNVEGCSVTIVDNEPVFVWSS